jgi:hypothetical protein
MALDSLQKALRFDEVIEPRYRAEINRIVRVGQIERAQRMSCRLSQVGDLRNQGKYVDFPDFKLPIAR